MRLKRFIICGRVAAPQPVPLVQMAQLYPQDSRLNLVQPAVPADFLAAVLVTGAVIAQGTEALRKLLGIGYNHAAVAPCSQILAGIEAEAARVGQRTGAPAMVGCSQRLGVVFDHV